MDYYSPLKSATYDDAMVFDSVMQTDMSESKRKAQNRAAQRAFRERKEQRVRELEDKLTESEKHMARLSEENERLRQENTIINTRNEVLQGYQGGGNNASNLPTQLSPTPHLQPSFPKQQFYDNLLERHDKTNQPSYIVYDQQERNDTMYGAGAMWELISENEEIDVEFVTAYLKDKARCDGKGPVWALKDIQEAIRIAAKLGKISINNNNSSSSST